MKLYYAHCMSIYDTPQEDRDIEMLQYMGFGVFNPNSPRGREGFENAGMDYFYTVINRECDGLAFRSLPYGRISAGVASEIMWNGNRPLIELPSGIYGRGISINETREYLAEVGQR